MRETSSDAGLVVIHSAPTWLPQTETWLHAQARSLMAHAELHVTCERVDNLDQFPVPSLHVAGRKGLVPRRRRAVGPVARVAKKHGAQVLHSHFGPTGWRNMTVARRKGLVHVVSFYGYDAGRVPRASQEWRERYLEMFEHVDLVLCEGPFLAGTVVGLGCPEDRVRVHHLGVDVARLPFRPPRWIPGTPLRVLLAASFREKKGLPAALAAVGQFVRDGGDAEVTVIGAAGTGADSQHQAERIQQTIEEYDLQPRVRMLGFQPHNRLMEHAAQHDVYMAPSITAADGDSEGGVPVAVIEMAAAGLVVVATRHCDIPSVVRHGETGLLADEHDVAGLRDALWWLVEHPHEWASLTRAARRHVEEQFDAAVQGTRLAALYESARGT